MAEWLKEFTQLLAQIRKQYVYNIYIYIYFWILYIYTHGSSLFQKVVLLTDSQNALRGPWPGHILKKKTLSYKSLKILEAGNKMQ